MSLLVSFGNAGWFQLYRLRQVTKSLQQENDKIFQNNRELQFEISNLKEAKYLEHYIREELGYVKEDEILYDFGGG